MKLVFFLYLCCFSFLNGDLLYDTIGIIDINSNNNNNNNNVSIVRRLMPNGINITEQQLLLNKHNECRSTTALGNTLNQPSSSNMNELTWDSNLASFAQNHVNKCVWEHSLSSDRRSIYGSPAGENIYVGVGYKENVNTLLSAIGAWYDEYKYYTYNKLGHSDCQSGKQCYHYTQIVWATSNQVGCAYAICPNITVSSSVWKNAIFLSCNYYGAGNYAGQYPYQNGSQCSSCPATKPYCNSNGLCSNILTAESPTTTTKSPTTKSPTTTTKSPTTTTKSPTTTTKSPTTTTKSPTTTTKSPTTTTKFPTTKFPTTKSPTTKSPTIITTNDLTTLPPTTPTSPSVENTKKCCKGRNYCFMLNDLTSCSSTRGCYLTSC